MKELYLALLECQRMILPVYKGNKGNFGKYASYEDIMMACRKPMLACELVVSHHKRDTETSMYLQTIVRHAPTGQCIEDLARVVPDKPGSAAVGAAITYTKRTSFVNLMGIVTTDVDNVDSGECEDVPSFEVITEAQVKMLIFEKNKIGARCAPVFNQYGLTTQEALAKIKKSDFNTILAAVRKCGEE